MLNIWYKKSRVYPDFYAQSDTFLLADVFEICVLNI